MPAGFKINALDPLVNPTRVDDNVIIGRGTQSFRQRLDGLYMPIPTIATVVDAGTPRGAWCYDPLDYWELVNMPKYVNGSEGSWSDIIYVPERKELWATAALNNGGNRNVICVSRDGRNWSGRANDETTVNNGIAYAPSLGLLCVCRSAGINTVDRFFTSTDGMTWTNRTISVASITFNCIAWSPTLSLFVAMGSSNAVWTSPDGVNWTQRTGPTSGGGWRRVLWAGSPLSKFVAFDGNNSAVSADGINWGAVSSVLPGNGTGLAWSPSLGMLVACDTNNNSTIKHSTNGTTWTTDTVTGGWNDVVWSEHLGKFVVVGGNRIATSPDGDNWTIQPSPFPHSSGVKRMVATR